MNRQRKVPVVKPRSRRQLEELAEKFLRRFDRERLKTPGSVDVVRAFDSFLPDKLGFRAHVDDSLPFPIEAVTDFAEREVRVSPRVYARAERGWGRPRFTIAHELGHVVTIGDEIGLKMRFEERTGISSQVVERREYIKAFEDPEWQADGFAAALIMPRVPFAFLYRHLTVMDGRVKSLMRTFGASKSAVETRLEQLRKNKWL